MITCGIDSGSRTVKAALVADGAVLATGLRDQGIDQAQLATELVAGLCTANELDPAGLDATVATGYARRSVTADHCVTEITCHAAGVHHLAPAARGIVEIGGQDSKAIRLDEAGRVADFAMNDRCAAGTGRFLEMVAIRLETPLPELGRLLAAGGPAADISSMCVVFAESEIIGLLAAGVPAAEILRGVQRAIAGRVAAMAGRLLADPMVFTGGVALVAGMANALAEGLDRPVRPAPQPLYTGAIGAALLAAGR